MPPLSEDTDSYHLVLATSFLIGISTLLPYNAFLSAPDFLQQYYEIVVSDGNSGGGEEADKTLQYENWWKTMPTFAALLGVFPNLLMQLLLLLPCGQRIVMYRRFCTSIIIMTACLAIVLLLCFVGGTSITEKSALIVLLLSITVCGAATGLIQATIFSFTAELPPVYTGTAMTGMASSGLIASILRIISKASSRADAPLVDAVSYFGVTISILILTLICIQCFLKKNPYALHHTNILSGVTATRLHSRRRSASIYIYRNRDGRGIQNQSAVAVEVDEETGNEHPNNNNINRHTTVQTGAGHITWQVLLRTRYFLSCMFGIFATTFIVFPGVSIDVLPENDWYAILVVTFYNAGDVLGRLGSSSSKKPILLVAAQYLLGMTLLRFVVFVPLLIILASDLTNGDVSLMKVSLTICFLLGLTNGSLGTSCAIHAPKNEETRRNKNIAGNAISCSLLGGCTTGALIAIGITSALHSG